MRYFILAVVLCSLGCSKPQTPPSKADAVVVEKAKAEAAPTEPNEQKLVREWVEKEHTGDPVNWLKWWPVVDTEKAGLPTYFADRKAERDRRERPTHGSVVDEVMSEPTKKSPNRVLPDQMLRVRYRVADKKGLEELHDDVFFFVKGELKGFFHRPLQDKDAQFRSFAWKAFR